MHSPHVACARHIACGLPRLELDHHGLLGLGFLQSQVAHGLNESCRHDLHSAQLPPWPSPSHAQLIDRATSLSPLAEAFLARESLDWLDSALPFLRNFAEFPAVWSRSHSKIRSTPQGSLELTKQVPCSRPRQPKLRGFHSTLVIEEPMDQGARHGSTLELFEADRKPHLSFGPFV